MSDEEYAAWRAEWLKRFEAEFASFECKGMSDDEIEKSPLADLMVEMIDKLQERQKAIAY